MTITKHLIIEKDNHQYRAIGKVNHIDVVGYGNTHSEALEEAFNNLYHHE